jgi:uroporphyrinogen-III synthase
MLVVLTREDGYNELLRQWLPVNVTVAEVPLTTTNYLELDDVESSLHYLPHYDSYRYLVVSSPRSARYIRGARAALGANGRVLAVGPDTAQSLRDLGVVVDGESKAGAIDLVPLINRGPVLMVGASIMRDELPNALNEAGIEVTRLACYETVPVVLTKSDEQHLREADVVFIGAPSAWQVGASLIREETLVVVPGPTTGHEVRRSHERVLEAWGPSVLEHLLVL